MRAITGAYPEPNKTLFELHKIKMMTGGCGNRSAEAVRRDGARGAAYVCFLVRTLRSSHSVLWSWRWNREFDVSRSIQV